MLTAAELALMRDQASEALGDTCQIMRASSDTPVLDPVTAAYTVGDPVVVWDGSCQVRSMSQDDRLSVIGGDPIIVGDYVATVPYDASGILADDYLEITDATDALMVGRSFRIVAVRWSAPQVNRRLVLEERQSSATRS